MDIYGAKFQEHCFNISRDIVYSVFTTKIKWALGLTLEVVNGDINFGFWTERDWSQKSYYGNNTKGVICFFL